MVRLYNIVGKWVEVAALRCMAIEKDYVALNEFVGEDVQRIWAEYQNELRDIGQGRITMYTTLTQEGWYLHKETTNFLFFRHSGNQFTIGLCKQTLLTCRYPNVD